MTEEQIRQNAEMYAELVTAGNKEHYRAIYTAAKEGYETGAHSRDEEIDKIKEGKCSLRRSLHRRISALVKEIDGLEDELKKLRNPWMSVDERLPEKLENDCVSDYVLTRIDGPKQVWYLVNKYNYAIKAWEGCNNNTTHWMPIQELKKGE